MNAPDLAEELADFWLPVLAERTWEERAGMLEQILGQLAEDTLDFKFYRQLVPLFLAAIIDRLGVDEPVSTRTQARIYAQSAAPKHRAMALEPFPDIYSRPTWRGHPRNNPFDRRDAPRHRVSASGTIELGSGRQSITGRIEDLSRTGARVSWPTILDCGQTLRLRLTPKAPPRQAQVVRVDEHGCGLAFGPFAVCVGDGNLPRG